MDDRINDLVSQMTDTEKVGMMIINDNNAGCAGAVTSTAVDYINNQKMTRFILRSTATATADPCDGSVTPGRGGYKVTPQQLAAYTNALQEMAENTRLGIPLVFKTMPATMSRPIHARALVPAPAPSASSRRKPAWPLPRWASSSSRKVRRPPATCR